MVLSTYNSLDMKESTINLIEFFRRLAPFLPQDDQRLPQEVCAATLQRSGVDQGRSGLSGPLRSQIPGSSREAGTQADRALSPGWGNDEEGGHGEWIKALMRRSHVKHYGGNYREMGWKAVVSVRYGDPCETPGGGLLGNWKKKLKAADGQLRETASSAALLQRGGLPQHVADGQ